MLIKMSVITPGISGMIHPSTWNMANEVKYFAFQTCFHFYFADSKLPSCLGCRSPSPRPSRPLNLKVVWIIWSFFQNISLNKWCFLSLRNMCTWEMTSDRKNSGIHHISFLWNTSLSQKRISLIIKHINQLMKLIDNLGPTETG